MSYYSEPHGKADKLAGKTTKKYRSLRRQKSSEDDTSPVLGIKILPVSNKLSPTQKHNDVPNYETASVGEFVCCLCNKHYTNAMSLAEHKCNRIVNLKYECTVCNKSFSCPANLASHKRWHKPKGHKVKEQSSDKTNSSSQKKTIGSILTGPDKNLKNVNTESIYKCSVCGRLFRRDLNRKKHELIKHKNVNQKTTLKSSNAVKKYSDKKSEFSRPTLRNNKICSNKTYESKLAEYPDTNLGIKDCKPMDFSRTSNYDHNKIARVTTYQIPITNIYNKATDFPYKLGKDTVPDYMAHLLFNQYVNQYIEWRHSAYPSLKYFSPNVIYPKPFLQYN